MKRGTSDSLSISERKVLELWDAGTGSFAIAARLGLRHDYVMRIISCYHDEGEQPHRRRMAKGSARLATAIAAAITAERA